MPAAESQKPRLAVLVSGPSEAALRRFLALHVKPHLGLHKNQWRARYREEYPLVVLARTLRQGNDASALYGPHAGAMVLVLGCLDEGLPGSGFAATRDWCKAQGFAPLAWVSLLQGVAEYELIEQGLEVVRFVNQHCPWPSQPIDDLDAYVAKSGRSIW